MPISPYLPRLRQGRYGEIGENLITLNVTLSR